MNSRFTFALLGWFLLATEAPATSEHEYAIDEYDTICEGISPDKRLAITTHAGGEGFHLYLFDALAGSKIGPLEEITQHLDSAADSYVARWSADSAHVSIVYRVSRHEPLKGMSYDIAGRRAKPLTKEPVDLDYGDPLCKLWQQSKPTTKIFGHIRHQPYEYGEDEHVVVCKGISPDKRLAITAHGGGKTGYDGFHVYLFDVSTGSKIGPLEEVVNVRYTCAAAFVAQWGLDSGTVTIIYETDNWSLKAMSYQVSKRRARPLSKEPIDLDFERSNPLTKFWTKLWYEALPLGVSFGHPKK